MGNWCSCTADKGIQCRNPRVSCPFCIATVSLLLVIAYTLPLIFAYERYERWVETKCTAYNVLMRQRQCKIQVCPSPSPTTLASDCVATEARCYTCQFQVTTQTFDGYDLAAYTDFYGNWLTMDDAAAACQSKLVSSNAGSPLRCWYQPSQPSGSRFYLSLDEPTVTVSTTPIFVFLVVLVLASFMFVGCHCWTAKVDEEWESRLALARERAAQRNMRVSRWSDYFGPLQEDPVEQMRARRRLAHVGQPSSAQAVQPGQGETGITTYHNPMIAFLAPASPR